MKKDRIKEHFITSFYTLDLGWFAKIKNYFKDWVSDTQLKTEDFLPFPELKKYACNNLYNLSYHPAKIDNHSYSGSGEIVFPVFRVI